MYYFYFKRKPVGNIPIKHLYFTVDIIFDEISIIRGNLEEGIVCYLLLGYGYIILNPTIPRYFHHLP